MCSFKTLRSEDLHFDFLQDELIEIKYSTLVTQTLGFLPLNYSFSAVLLFYISSY